MSAMTRLFLLFSLLGFLPLHGEMPLREVRPIRELDAERREQRLPVAIEATA